MAVEVVAGGTYTAAHRGVTSSGHRAGRWCRAAGVKDLGRTQGSGLQRSTYLLRRGDGQVLQVSELLHLVLREVSADRDESQVAAAVSTAFGRELTVDGLRHLVRTKLAPMGLVQELDGLGHPEAGAAPRSDPLLTLRLRRTLIPAAGVRALGRVMAPLFRREVVVAVLLATLAVDVGVLRQGDLIGALTQVLATPTFLLALFAMLTAGALVHELGHAAACSYGGAHPGVIGAGVYLVFPAFFTDVTDSYRLDRPGRLRTDLGGLYLNVWCVLAVGGAYLATGQGVLLLVLLLMHLEMLQQLVPAVRFDGYFVLADLAGVPDLFARVGPVLRSALPGRPADPRVQELRPWSRRLVVAWVLVVTPTLLFAFGWLLYSLPYLVRRTWSALSDQATTVADSWRAHAPATLLLAVLSIVLLAVPLVGAGMLIYQVALRTARAGLHAVHSERADETDTSGDETSSGGGDAESHNPESHNAESHNAESHVREPDPVPTERHTSETPVSDTPIYDALTAAAFTDEAILGPVEGPRPDRGWRRTVFTVTRGAVNPGPSAEERRRAETLARVTAPISGSRRVVVMSRKGGVGKTTITLTLGSTFATLRGDRVVAVDANPDAGNLAHRVARPTGRTITHVLNEMTRISSYADLRGYTAQAAESRLEVLASDDDPRIGLALDRDAYHRVIELLDHYYNLILLDTGTGILDSANQGLLTEADQLVLVLRSAVDGARAAALTLDWLSEHGYGELVARAVVVINAVRRGTGVPIERIEDHFAQRCATVVSVPWDPALETGAQTNISGLRPATRDALTELAASVADHFTAQVPTRHR